MAHCKKGKTGIAHFSGRKGQKHDGRYCSPGKLGKNRR